MKISWMNQWIQLNEWIDKWMNFNWTNESIEYWNWYKLAFNLKRDCFNDEGN